MAFVLGAVAAAPDAILAVWSLVGRQWALSHLATYR